MLEDQLTPWVLIVLAILNTPVYYGLYRLIFRDAEDLMNSIWFWFKWDTWSLFDGTFFEDMWREIRLSMFGALSAGAVYGECYLLNTLFTPVVQPLFSRLLTH